MLVDSSIFTRIDEIVERAYIGFLFTIVGDEFLTDEQKIQAQALGLILGQRPLIETLYILVRQRSEERYQTDATLQRLLSEIEATGVLPVINDAQKATLDVAKIQLQETIENAKNLAKKNAKEAIISANNEEKQRQSVSGIVNIGAEREAKTTSINALTSIIGASLIASNRQFVKDITNTMTDFINNTVVDQAQTQFGAQSVKDIIVYKVVNNDGSLCQWCRTFYTNEDGSPKEYKLSELQKNGTNDGQPKSAWKPTVSKTHPRCRCQLHIKST